MHALHPPAPTLSTFKRRQKPVGEDTGIEDNFQSLPAGFARLQSSTSSMAASNSFPTAAPNPQLAFMSPGRDHNGDYDDR